jgi:RNA polymerase sigma factor (sigma-70 family)
MRDVEMVALIVAGEPDGLAAAYDRYAPALHAYCRSLLGEPAAADEAVQDTFIIAADELSGLGDPRRLRPWLYAVARNECRYRLRSRAWSAPPGDSGELSDDTVDDLAGDAERAELRAVASAALAGLSPRDREIIELNLRHDLAGQDLADILGVSVNQAYALTSRVRVHFEAWLGALLVARDGRESCPELAIGLESWDGQLGELVPKRVNRHIQHCEICDERRRRELDPALVLGALPLALPSAGLRDQLLRLIGDESPAASAYRIEVIRRAGPFSQSGFPEPLDPPRASYRPKPPALLTAGVAALAVFAGGALFGADVLKPHTTLPPVAAGKEPFAAPTAPAGTGITVKPAHSTRRGHSDPSPSAPIVPWVAATGPTVRISSSRPSPSAKPPSAAPSPAPSVSPSPSPTPTDSPSPTGSPSPTDSASASSSPTAGATATALVPSLALRLEVVLPSS